MKLSVKVWVGGPGKVSVEVLPGGTVEVSVGDPVSLSVAVVVTVGGIV